MINLDELEAGATPSPVEVQALVKIAKAAQAWSEAPCESKGYCEQCNDYCGDCISPGHNSNCDVKIAEDELRREIAALGVDQP